MNKLFRTTNNEVCNNTDSPELSILDDYAASENYDSQQKPPKGVITVAYEKNYLQEQLNYAVGEVLRAEARVNKLYRKGQLCLQKQNKIL